MNYHPAQWQLSIPADHPIWTAYMDWQESLFERSSAWYSGTREQYRQECQKSAQLWRVYDDLRKSL